jgi:hypothetical protein
MYGLPVVKTEHRSGEDQRADQSDGHLDKFKTTLAQAAFIAKMNRKRDER